MSHKWAPELPIDILRRYLHPRYAPGDQNCDIKTAKNFRVRYEHQTLLCVLAQYGFAHLLDEDIILRNGLYGNLIIQGDIIRWLALPELCNAMGLLRPWSAPLAPQESFKLVGNAIATPHALLCLTNALGQLDQVTWTSTPLDLLDRAFQSFLSASKQEVLVFSDSRRIEIRELAVSPTLPWTGIEPPLATWSLPWGTDTRLVKVQPGLPMARVIRYLFPEAHGSSIAWKSSAYPDLPIPLTIEDTTGSGRVTLEGVFGPLSLREEDCQGSKRPFVVVCSPSQLCILTKSPTTRLQELPYKLGPFFLQDSDFTDIWGHHLSPDIPCPDTVFMIPAVADTPVCEQIQSLHWIEDEQGWKIEAGEADLNQYIHFARATGLMALIESVGWSFALVPSCPGYRRMPCLVFRPSSVCPSIARSSFHTYCTTLIAQALLPPEIPDMQGLQVRIKFWGTWRPTRTWPREIRVSDIVEPWSIAARHTGRPSAVRAIHVGRQMTPEERVAQYLTDPMTTHPVKIHFVLQQEGGGNKIDAHLRVKQQTLEFLLQCGADPAAVKQFTHDLFEQAGMARLQHTLQIRDTEERHAQLIRLAKSFHIRPISFEDLEAERNKKLRSWKPKAVTPTTFVSAADFRIAEGAFSYADGTIAAIYDGSTETIEGVMLIDAEEANTFLGTTQKKPKAFALCILGNACPVVSSRCHPIHVPAEDKQRTKVVLKGCMHQCGENDVSLTHKADSDVKVAASTLVAVTVWKSEVSQAIWEQVQTAPAKTCAQILSLKPAEHYSAAPWGRTFRDGEQICSPETAISFQFHCRIRTGSLEMFMARSGMEGAYVTPKSETLNRADEQYTVVWMPESTWPQVKEFALELSDHLGLARSTGKHVHWGVRTHADKFAAAYVRAFPGKPIPPVLTTHFLAKINPVPTGATSENVRTWLVTQKIEGKPVRALNNNAWLISTVQRQERAFFTWGQNSVLLTPIQSKYEKSKPTVMAGQQRLTRSWQSLGDPEVDPLMQDDPWSMWTPASSTSAASTSSKDRSQSDMPSKGQNLSITQQAEIQVVKEKLRSLEEKFEQKHQTDDAWKSSITRDVKAFKEEVRCDLQGMEKQYQQTLEKALEKTEQKLCQSMKASIQELQTFMMTQAKPASATVTQKRQTPPSPAKEDADAEMPPVP